MGLVVIVMVTHYTLFLFKSSQRQKYKEVCVE